MANLLKDAISGIIKPVTDLASELIEDKDKKAEFKQRALELTSGEQMMQMAINLKDAASEKFIQYGWRPFLGWVGGVAVAYHYILQPFLVFGFTMAGFSDEVKDLPNLQIYELLGLLGTLLGAYKLRNDDKKNRRESDK